MAPKKGWLFSLRDAPNSSWGGPDAFFRDLEANPGLLDSTVWGKVLVKGLRLEPGDGLAFYHSTRAAFPRNDPHRRRARISLVGELVGVDQSGQQVERVSVRIDPDRLSWMRAHPIVRDANTEELFLESGMVRGAVATFYPVPPNAWRRIEQLAQCPETRATAELIRVDSADSPSNPSPNESVAASASEETVDSEEHVRANVKRFNRDARVAPVEILRPLLTQTKYWVWEPGDAIFAPSKFAGIRDITFDRYRLAMNAARARGRVSGFDGHTSRLAVERVLGTSYQSMPDLAPRLVAWAEGLAGRDVMRGVDATKWQFVSMQRGRAEAPTRTESHSLEDQLRRLAELDAQRAAAARLEQSILRDHVLNGSPSGTCAICGEDFPSVLLVAGHIKRRADCSEEEKRDLHNVMAVCAFGCDTLFERGFLIVKEAGVIDHGPTSPMTATVSRKVSNLCGRKCAAWSTANAEYFSARRASFQEQSAR